MYENGLKIISPARLHFVLLNETGLLGRVDGGIGVSLSEPHWEIDVIRGRHSPQATTLCAKHQTAIEFALDRLSHLVPKNDVSVIVRKAIPPHVGLGSKTSLMMAIGKAVSILAGVSLMPLQLARIMERGGTSGIGVHSFSGGGFIWDAGHKFPEAKKEFGPSSLALAAPPLAILSLPVDWISIVHFRFLREGIHGVDEVSAFKSTCPVPYEETAETLLCVISQVVPAFLEKDEPLLHAGIRRLQKIGFKKIEWEHQDELTKKFRDYWEESGAFEALGLSAFGPTLYVLTSRPSEVRKVIDDFGSPPIHMCETTINNRGAIIGEVV